MKRTTLFPGFIPLTFFALLISCTHNPDDIILPQDNGGTEPPIDTIACDPDTVYFQNTVLPLIQSTCATTGCHDAASHQHGITSNQL